MSNYQNQDVCLENCEKWRLHSSLNDVDYEISVAYPPVWVTSKGPFPTVYLLDSDSCFGLVTNMVRMLNVTSELPAILIVGIGYPEKDLNSFANRRLQDFTPSVDTEYKKNWDSELELTSDGGGAARFLDFLRYELIPTISKRYPVAKCERTLVGHSLGGLFSLYSLLQGPSTFSNYIVGSPAIFWGDWVIWRYLENQSLKRNSFRGRVFIGIGGDEDKMPFHFPEGSRANMGSISLINDVIKVSSIFNNYRFSDLEVDTKILPNETHMSVVAPLINRGLRFVFHT